MSDFFTAEQIEKIVDCALKAGEIAADFQKSGDFEIMKKADGSSVTSADIAVSKFIAQKLTAEFPQIPVICEEGDMRSANDIFWLIDPIDGTSGFINGVDEFSINIALVKDAKVIFGLICAPLFEGGKVIFSDHENKIIERDKSDKRKTLIFSKTVSQSLRIVTSPRSKDSDIEGYMAQFHQEFGQNFIVERLSSALKFFRILEDGADLYLHFRPSMEWDTAAGQALVEMMGGSVKTLSHTENKFTIGDSMVYKKPSFLNQSFVTFIS